MKILVCIPHVPGRGPYLANAVMGYDRYTPEGQWVLSIVEDAKSAGEGWNRCAEQGLEWWSDATHIHFSNDDVVPASDWWRQLVEATDEGYLPAPRIEPAGGHCPEQIFQTHPPMPPAYPMQRDKMAYFYSDLQENQPTEDWTPVPHGNLPFCTVDQWREIGPFPLAHYGTDGYFYNRGRALGYEVVARTGSVFYNFNANIGRHRGDWTEQDFLDFDGIFGVPAYERGEIPIDQEHPLRETAEGLAMVREWRQRHVEAGG